MAPHGVNLSSLNLFGVRLYMGKPIYILLVNWTGFYTLFNEKCVTDCSHHPMTLYDKFETLNLGESISLKKDIIHSYFLAQR